MPEIILFIALSVPILYVSRHSLTERQSHGFYRFFAWEFILALFVLNYPQWFWEPFAFHQLISWVLLGLSIYLVSAGFWLLKMSGRSSNRAEQPANLAFENTTSLLTNGIYRQIRHPMYSSLLFLNWAIFLKNISLLAFALALVASAFLVLTARKEEKKNIQYFGAAYAIYMKHSKMFIPYIL